MLPNPHRAVVDIRKLRDYALSMESKTGRHKARVFRSALGLGPEDAEWLRARILEDIRATPAVPKGETPYGPLYQADVWVDTGTRSAVVRTGWIVYVGESFARLITCYVLT